MSIASPPGAAAGARRRAPVLLVGFPILVLVLGGCGQRMAVKVNGQVVSQDQFYKECSNFTQGQGLGPPVGLMVLNQIVREQLVTQEANRRSVTATDAEVNKELENIRKQMAGSTASLEDRLKQVGLPLDVLKNEIRLGLLQRKLATQGVTVSDKEIEEFYNRNKQSQFTTPEQVDARQITVATEAAAKEVKQTLDKNAAFELVAQSKSIDQYKSQNGKLPTLQRGFPPPGVNPEVFSMAFKTPEGKTTEPFKVGNQWVILKVDKKKPQSTRTLADLKEELRQQLLMQKAQQAGQLVKFQQRMMELQRDADIQVGLDQFKEPIEQQQKSLKQAPAPGLTPVLPGGR